MKKLLVAAVIGIFLSTPAVNARDPGGKYAQANPQLHDWFESLTNQNKGPCCADADGNVIKDSDWQSVNDPSKPNVHYKVKLQGNWYDVPDDAVVTKPNIYGRTVVWPIPQWDKDKESFKIRCFMPGAEG